MLTNVGRKCKRAKDLESSLRELDLSLARTHARTAARDRIISPRRVFLKNFLSSDCRSTVGGL